MPSEIELLPGSPTAFAADASCVDADGSIYFQRVSETYVSSDNGATWIARSGGNPSGNARGFLYADGNTIYRGNYGGYIYKTSDKGLSWTELTSAGSRNWQAIAGDGSALYFCAQGYIYKSTDGGNSVIVLTASGSKNRLAAICVGSTLYVGVFGANIEVSSDGGVTFTAIPGSGSRQWTYTPTHHNGALYFAEYGANGRIWKSSDGATWSAVGPNASGGWRESCSGGDGAAYFTDYGYRVWRTYDDGTTFEAVPPTANNAWYTITSHPNGDVYLAEYVGGGINEGIWVIRKSGFTGVRPAQSGAWRNASEVHVAKDGVWRKANRIFVPVSGAWREVL